VNGNGGKPVGGFDFEQLIHGPLYRTSFFLSLSRAVQF
jgi:hypothetical protein